MVRLGGDGDNDAMMTAMMIVRCQQAAAAAGGWYLTARVSLPAACCSKPEVSITSEVGRNSRRSLFSRTSQPFV